MNEASQPHKTDKQQEAPLLPSAGLRQQPAEPQWVQERQIAQLERLLDRVRRWVDTAPQWEPISGAKPLLDRLEPRLRDLRLQLDSVLVVGLVGGTGVGKSTLLNALVGEKVCEAGKEHRPTTRRPEILCAPGVDPSFLKLESCHPRVHELSIPLLENMILIDCPDPDTQPTGGEVSSNRNRDILRQVLPHCDVILYVGSQEKYRSQAITTELLRNAPGRRIVFLQSRAGRDEDIREHWRQTLQEAGFEIPEIYRIDAEEALRHKQDGAPAGEDFLRLTRLLQEELAGRVRHRIKRANALDLCGWMIAQMQEPLSEKLPLVRETVLEVERQQQVLRARIRAALEVQLRENRSAWRSRLMEKLNERWTVGPFAGVLRLAGSIGGLLRWVPLSRARSLTQLAVIGSVTGASAARDWWKQLRGSRAITASDDLGISAADVAQARSVVEGYAYDAGLQDLIDHQTGRLRDQYCDETLTQLAARLQGRVEAALDAATQKRVARRAGKFAHFVYEVGYLLLPGALILHLGKNFFYDHLWLGKELVGLEFLIHALIWLLVWTWLFRGMLMRRLTRGLKSDVLAVVDQVVADSSLASFADDITDAAQRVERHAQDLSMLSDDLQHLRHQLGQLEDVPVGRLTI